MVHKLPGRGERAKTNKKTRKPAKKNPMKKKKNPGY